MNMVMNEAVGVADTPEGSREVDGVIPMRLNEPGLYTPHDQPPSASPSLVGCVFTHESNSLCCARSTTPAVTDGRRHVAEIVSKVLEVQAARLVLTTISLLLLVGFGATKVR